MSDKKNNEESHFGQEPLEDSEKETNKAATAIVDEPAETEAAASSTIQDEEVQNETPEEQTKRGRGRPAKKLVNAIREQRKKGILIPDKLYFAISEVAEICGVKPYVLRYWESEFKLLRPSKNPSGQRMYQRKDIDMVFRIKKYLYDEGFTISGAKKKLKEDRKAAQSGDGAPKEMLNKIKGELSDILKTVKK